jgi:hypothetical protein
MRWLCAVLFYAWNGGLLAEELTVFPDGRFVSPGGMFAVELRVADGAPLAVAGEKRVVKLPGVLTPAAQWRTATGLTVRLDLCLVQRPLGLGEVTLVGARVQLTNPTDRPQMTALAVQLTPERAVSALAFERHAFSIEGQPVLVADALSRGAILAASALAARPLTPQDIAYITSIDGQCRGEMLFDVTLAPGQTQTFGWLCPAGPAVDLEYCRALVIEELFAQAAEEATAAR